MKKTSFVLNKLEQNNCFTHFAQVSVLTNMNMTLNISNSKGMLPAGHLRDRNPMPRVTLTTKLLLMEILFSLTTL